jgi:penicillin-binding protein 2
LNNKVISGEYPPGSTFKIVTGSAAFELDKVKLDELIYDGGFHPLVPTMGNAGGEVLGWLSFIKGLAMSDNVYFYELGYRVGIDAIAKYARIYGFGAPTGIDLEGESSGLVASKQVKLDIWNEGWRLGDTFNAAIGQGFNLSTPLQLAVMLSCVANGGIKYQPYLVEAFYNPDGTIYGAPERAEGKHIDVSQRTIDYMRDGMSATTEAGGTAAYFRTLPRKVAGKTGTAENPHGRDHGLFVAYGPVENPELVVVAIVEQGGYGSSSAGPIVYKTFEEFYREKGWMPPEPTKEELEAMARVEAAQKELAERTERMKREALADKKAQEALAKAKVEAEKVAAEMKKADEEEKAKADKKKKSKKKKDKKED